MYELKLQDIFICVFENIYYFQMKVKCLYK